MQGGPLLLIFTFSFYKQETTSPRPPPMQGRQAAGNLQRHTPLSSKEHGGCADGGGTGPPHGPWGLGGL